MKGKEQEPPTADQVKNKIPEFVQWLEVGGFVALYLEHFSGTDGITSREAYEMAETRFKAIYHKKRYANYESFIQSKWRWQNRQKKAKQQNNPLP